MYTLKQILMQVRNDQRAYGDEIAAGTLAAMITCESTSEAEDIYNAATFAIGDYSICYPLPFFDCKITDAPHLHVHDDKFEQLLDTLEACI